jgi:hypothetical protein
VRRVEAREASIGDSSPLVVSKAGVPVETFTGGELREIREGASEFGGMRGGEMAFLAPLDHSCKPTV